MKFFKWPRFKMFSGSDSLMMVLGAVTGLLIGVGVYTFIYAKGGSYFSNKPEACVNCHVMKDQYDSWVKSTHHAVASCNDCHSPHDFIGKYKTKAMNGFWHSFYFTAGNYKEPIQATKRNKEIVQINCRACHENIVHAVDVGQKAGDSLSCVKCHGSVGHP